MANLTDAIVQAIKDGNSEEVAILLDAYEQLRAVLVEMDGKENEHNG